MGMVSAVQAVQVDCSAAPYNGLIDGNIYPVPPANIKIDTNCTIQNFPASNPLNTNFSFDNAVPLLAIFDNVIHTGQMSCNTGAGHKIWFTNGSVTDIPASCQNFVIPAETIDKQPPVGQTSAGIGDPFTYTLTLPSMQFPAGDPSPNNLTDVVIWDDLNATGADLSLVGTPVVSLGGVPLTEGVDYTFTNVGGLLTFNIPSITTGIQIDIEITVVLNDTPANVVGASFTNTAKWQFVREIDVNEDGFIDPLTEIFTLPGEWGVATMVIAEPDLILTKTADQTTLNIGVVATFTIDIQNNGGGSAWNVTMLDRIPEDVNAGMCDYDPTTGPITAQVFSAAGSPVTGLLLLGTHYTATYDAVACELSVEITSPLVKIEPTQYLRITFQSQLNGDSTADPFPLINTAAATQWFSADPAGAYPARTYTRALTDGTPAIIDHEDSFTITTTLSGYIFQKTVENLSTGVNPATTAAGGDQLRYRLRLFNVDQTFNDITIEDVLDPGLFDTTTFASVSSPAGSTFSFDSGTGLLTYTGFGIPLNSAAGDEHIFEFDINLLPGLVNGTVVPNQATLNATNEIPAPVSVTSDDPFVNGTSIPYTPGDVTNLLIQAPGPLSKAITQPSATIGEQFKYTIAVPATPVDVPLYDVRIHDNLALSSAGMSFVSANVVSGGTWTLSNAGTSTNIIIEDAITGIDIPANGQAVIEITVELLNVAGNVDGLLFSNSAWYFYSRSEGGSKTLGGTGNSSDMTVVESSLSAIKTVTNATLGKLPTDPITDGDILEYVVTVTNDSTTATAYDVNIVDVLPAELAYYAAFTPTATINTIAVAGFEPIPTGAPAGPLIWGVDNADGSLDIPASGELVLTYQTQVSVGTAAFFSNEVYIDWTSLDGSSASERSGVGCPTVTSPDEYCFGPVTVTSVIDNNSLTKAVIADSWITDGSTALDATVRVGDTVTYQLTLNLGEGVTNAVTVSDVLPAGMVFDSLVSITPVSGGASFTYTLVTEPIAGDTSTLIWDFGSITNTPSGDGTPTDALVIEYNARVIENAASTIAQLPTTSLNNTATLAYENSSGILVVDPVRLESSSSITVLQPVMDLLSKSDRLARASPLVVDIVNDTMEFRVSSCNTTGLAPAYNVQITDVLASELNETTITGPINGAGNPDVYINGVLLTAITDYTYTAPAARGGSMVFQLIAPVAAGQCVDIDYNIGFHSDITANSTWNNSASLDDYYSINGSLGQLYPALAPVIYTMSNTSVIDPPTKTTLSPLSGEATIGEEVVYQITVPSVPRNAVLYDVNITDTLATSLIYVSATDVSGNGFVITDTSVLPDQVNLNIAQIPAGQQAVIEVRARIDNTAAVNAGNVFSNTASYAFADTSGGLQIAGGSATTATSINVVEPLLVLAKTVDNISSPAQPPTAGDILRYTLTLTATAGANFSDVFDVSIEDSFSLGMAYSGNPVVTGAGNTISAPVIVGDGITLAQSLSWSLADGNADIDIPEGTAVTLSYDVIVLDGVLAGQTLNNSAVAQWTSVDAIDPNERNGSGSTTENDYFTAPVVATLITPDTNAITKSVVNETFGAVDGAVRIGDIVEYELRINLQEGISSSVSLIDSLQQGLQFEGVVSINGDTVAPYTAVSPFTHSDIATPTSFGNPVTGPTTLLWNIGDITNAGDNNPANNDFVIIYRARVLNGVLAQVNLTTLTNTVNFSYTSATGTTILTSSSILTVEQPLLAVSKIATPTGGDSIIDANELVTYTVDITNSGAAPAYDVVLQDVIPAGLRNGAATITMISNSLLVAGTTPPNIIPTYDSVTGIANWNFDSGVANQYSIPAGDTLRVIYQVQAEATLSASMTLTNQAQVQLYYSFDNNAVPTLGSVSGVSEIYGPSNIASATLTTAGPNALSKQNPAILSVAVGETFNYRITVPATPMTTALNDVRILDNLAASAADLGFVSVTRISGSQPWTPVNTGTVNNLIIEDTTNGIDIPAGEQIVIDVSVVVNDSPTNVSGLLFNNTASYTYNQINDDVGSESPGGGDTTADMTIIGPDTVTMSKTGPVQMNPSIPEVFTLNMHNTGTATAWDLTITDVLPNPDPGGMCDIPPANITAQIFLADGVTPVSAVLVQGTDYTTAFAPAPDCTLTLTMVSAAAALPADNRLIISYEALIDLDNPQGTILTNVAGATEWFSGDTAGAGATGQIRTYTQTLTDGTVGTLDHEDAHSIETQTPVIQFSKTVVNVTTGENPGTIAQPGDTLRYSLLIQNLSVVTLTDFTVTDEVDRLNASPMFEPGSLTVVTAPVGADSSNTNVNGGSNGTGLMDVRGMTLDPAGGANDTLLIEFEVTLAPVITSNTVVLNQAQLDSIMTGTLDSDEPVINGVDDPLVQGDEDPTPITINSAPVFEVWKTSQDLTGDPTVLDPGDTLRYTITVKNIGTEDAINVQLLDQVPTNTSYLANSTSLNGAAVADPTAGISPLQAGTLINSADTATAGYLVANTDPLANNVATISFDVVVNLSAIAGSVISNQGFVNGDGQGSGPFIEQVTDDPDTATIGDPTVDIVGSLPLIDVLKTVALQVDNGTPGIVDPGDTLRYTITVSNAGATVATGVVLSDATPVDTTYVADSVLLNGVPVGQPDGGVSPLIAGIDVSTSDLPWPAPGAGTLTPGQLATITFDVQVNAAVAAGTVISNQGVVSSVEQADEPTDADGIDSNGDQATQIVVGNAQLLSITKEVLVVGGGAALAGGQLEYIIRVTNISAVPANSVVITDNLDDPVVGQMSYVAASATLNGSAAGVSHAAPVITADYSTTYGDLLPGETATLSFLVDLNTALATGTTVTNNVQVDWNSPVQNATASVSVDIGGIPGVAGLNGTAWHDGNFNNLLDASEQLLAGWFVDVYRNGVLIGTVVTDANGVYQITGLSPNDISGDQYEIRFRAPDAGVNTAMLGMGGSIFTNGLQQISDIVVSSGSSTQNLNLLLNPNGVVYNSVMRTPIAGSTLTMVQSTTGTPLPTSCFDDAAQQGQVTPAGGYYRFDINFSDPACTSGGDYLINIVAPATGYLAAPSNAIAAVTDASTAAYSVPVCSADAVVTTAHCEAQASVSAPASNVVVGAATNYYMHLTLSNTAIPQDSQLFNNHIPIDPDLSNAVTITKTSSLLNVTRGQMVPYTITASNTLSVALPINIVDTIPPGFRYVNGSARIDGVDSEPVFDGLALTWPNVTLETGTDHVLQLILVVGSGVSEGEYINRAQIIVGLTGDPASEEATATVHVVPDPTFDCTDIIGKVFDDANMNGYQDEGEKGIANARIVSARGLIMKTDKHGRFHITCAVVPNQDRGSNFILKLDERSLPSGYRILTENPRVQRATRGKMMKFNFGATIHRVIRLDIAGPVFEKGSTEIRLQWKPRLNLLMDELKKGSSILRISYLADIEETGLVDDRIDVIKQEIMRLREEQNCCEVLTVETEIFWRRGGPPSRGSID